MQSFTRWLAMLLAFALIACADDESPRDPPRDATTDSAPIDSASGESCQGSPSSGCEQVVDDVDECPALDDVCDGVCGASYDCCYCGDDGQWKTLFIDCPSCPDAGGIDAI
jgi:hypothetical protein